MTKYEPYYKCERCGAAVTEACEHLDYPCEIDGIMVKTEDTLTDVHVTTPQTLLLEGPSRRFVVTL